ncbi:MAG: hypothetical protein CM15mP32_0630 [Flavobacteriaceae bacterium]|nr:MAG: hypothetical protein CM15mP32_0630 [Flavobacteriaceae bacterium]
MQFQLIQSKLLDKNELWSTYEKALNRFGEINIRLYNL